MKNIWSLTFYVMALFFFVRASITASHLFTWKTDAQMLAHKFTNAEVVGEVWVAGYFLLALAFMILAKLEKADG